MRAGYPTEPIPFTLCEVCKQLYPDQETCPRLSEAPFTSDVAVKLRERTPFSRWKTTTELAQDYNFSIRHIARLAEQQEIAAVNIERRWFIFFCSFWGYMQNRPARHERHKK